MGACLSSPEESAAQARLEAEQRRLEHWRTTGFVSLRDAAVSPSAAPNAAALVASAGAAAGEDDGPIRRLPQQVVDLAESARVLDVADNALECLSGIERLTELQRMVLSGNRLESLPGGRFASLLWLLAARNRIAALDPSDDLGARLPRLERLVLAHNRLEALPGSCIGGLRRLRVCALAHNRLTSLPDELGDLEALEEVDVQHNRLEALPASLARCARLRAVLASHNRIAAAGLPPEMFAPGALPLLQTVALKFNPVERADLDAVPGCVEFDRRARAQRAGGGGGGGGGESGGGGGASGASGGGGGCPLAGASSSGRGVLVGGTGAQDAAAVALRKTESRDIAPVALLLASGGAKRRMAAGETVLNGGGHALEALDEGEDAAGLAERGVPNGVLRSELRKGSGWPPRNPQQQQAFAAAANGKSGQGEGAALRAGGGGSGAAPLLPSPFARVAEQHRRDRAAFGGGGGSNGGGSNGGGSGGGGSGGGGDAAHWRHPPTSVPQDSPDMSDAGSVVCLRVHSASAGGNVLAVPRRTRSFVLERGAPAL